MLFRSCSCTLVFFVSCAGIGRTQIDEFEVEKLFAEEGAANEEFGRALDLDGDLMVVGVPRATPAQVATGAAIVFERVDGAWVEQQVLLASDRSAEDQFGSAVAVVGDVIVVGARFADGRAVESGAAYVFEKGEAGWVEVQKIFAPEGRRDESFGESLAMDADCLVVGSPTARSAGNTTGVAHVFCRIDGLWQQDQQLLASDAAAQDRFGASVAIEGRTVVVGAPEAVFSVGAAYVYREVDGFWVEEQLLPSDGIAGLEYGQSVAVSGDHVAVGALNGRSSTGTITGAVYAYTWRGDTWSEEKIVAAPLFSSFQFGVAVELDAEVLAIGSDFFTDSGEPNRAGRAFSYRFDGSRWVRLRTLLQSDPSENQFLGAALALDGDTLAVGAPGDEARGFATGAVYVYDHAALALAIVPETLRAGEQVRVATHGGLSGGFCVLFVLAVDDIPFHRGITAGRFRSDGQWELQNTVPPGLEGVNMTLSTIGFVQPGVIAESNQEVIRLR